MDKAEAALYPVAAVEEATNQSKEADPTRDRENKGFYLGQ